MANEKRVHVLVLPRCNISVEGELYTQGTVVEVPESVAKQHVADAEGNQAMVEIVKDVKEGNERYKKLRREYFQREHGTRKGDQMPNEEQLSKLYGGVAS